MISQDKIQEATRRLVEAYNPVAIYLFGSYAWGVPTEDSDLDFMVSTRLESETDLCRELVHRRAVRLEVMVILQFD